MKYIVDYIDKEKVTSRLHRQFTLYIVVGGISVLSDIIILYLLVSVSGLNVLISTVISFCLVTILNYVLSVKFLFQSGRLKRRHEILSFFLIAAIALFLTVYLINFFINEFKLWYMYAKILVVIIVSLFTFTVKKWVIFLK